MQRKLRNRRTCRRFDDAQEIIEKQNDIEAQLEKMRTTWDRETSPVVNANDIAVDTLTITNSGDAASGVVVTDTLPAQATYVSDTGGCTLVASGVLQ